MTEGIKLIVGLGNPGQQYENTRHNVGFWLVESLSKGYDGDFKLEAKFKCLVSSVIIYGHKCILLKPQTFMNLSGESVGKITKFYKIPVSSILVVHDELDFPPGVIKIKKGGGANGHNGVQNIINHIGSKDFWRMRVGIGKSKFKDDMSNFVLSKPSKSELEQIDDAIGKAVAIIPKLIEGDFSSATMELHSE